MTIIKEIVSLDDSDAPIDQTERVLRDHHKSIMHQSIYIGEIANFISRLDVIIHKTVIAVRALATGFVIMGLYVITNSIWPSFKLFPQTIHLPTIPKEIGAAIVGGIFLIIAALIGKIPTKSLQVDIAKLIEAIRKEENKRP